MDEQPTAEDYAEHYYGMIEHLHHVQRHIAMMQVELHQRSVTHDRSKFSKAENDTFAIVTKRLKTQTYGSNEYKASLVSMGEALRHHYDNNRHHTEFHPNGINGMNLIDLIEMMCDWAAAVKRHEDGDLGKSIEINRERYDISDQLVSILRNTASLFDKNTITLDDTQKNLG